MAKKSQELSEEQIRAKEDLISFFRSPGWVYFHELLLHEQREAYAALSQIRPIAEKLPEIASKQAIIAFTQRLMDLDADEMASRMEFPDEEASDGGDD